jgi:Fe2+ or Zn2+ uptake regulation protein
MEDPATVTRLFRAEGLKVTPQRQAIFGIMYRSPGHMTASAVYQEARAEMETISLKTVYETLHSLVALGLVRQLDLGTGQVLFDSSVTAHHHLVCNRCGRTEDVELDVEPLSDAQRRGFVVLDTEVVARGLCPRCAAESPGPELSHT